MAKRIRNYRRRWLIRAVVRLFQFLFTRTKVTGKQYIPKQGPYIAVGNHVAAIEVVLMVANLPHISELIGNGDVPLDPTYGFMANWYQFIPIKRGSVDRQALEAARQVLEAGNVLVVFPEGGIWEHDAKSARPGVAWLSQQTGAPILPVGFGGIKGALNKAYHLKRPRMIMNIGPLMPPVPQPTSPRERRQVLEAASSDIMQRIRALVPSENGAKPTKPVEEHYALRLDITAPDGSAVSLPDDLAIPHGDDVSFYFHRQLLLEVVYRNYKLTGARPLADFPTLRDPVQLGDALEVALDFYTREPAFLGYRLTYPRAERVVQGLRGLHQALAWAAGRKYQVHIIPERTIMHEGEVAEIQTEPTVRREY